MPILQKLRTSLLEALDGYSSSALRKERDKLELILTSMGEGLCVLGPDAEVIYANPEAFRLLGYKPAELLGGDFPELVEASELRVYIEQLNPGVSLRGKETLFCSAGGELLSVAYTLTPLTDESGILGSVLIFSDNTKRKEAEAVIRLARDRALQSSQAKSDFLATISHEIRTPLNGILSLAELILLTVEQDDVVRDVKTIKECATSLRGILEDVLDFSKIEAGSLILEQHPFDLCGSIEGIATQMRSIFQANRQELVMHFSSNLPRYVRGDQVRLQQILRNLLSNAAKFTQGGGAILIYADADPGVADDIELHLAVVDSGIGIAKDKLEKIFNEFEQAEMSTTREYGGTGLGLSISRRLANLMSGELWVESMPNVGSAFHLRVPLQVCGTSEKHDGSFGPETLLEGARRNSRSLKILVAEDNRTNAESLARVLSLVGHTIKVADNGETALKLFSHDKFDVVLMDLHMPNLDGFLTTQSIRVEHKSLVPIIAITADALADTANRCKEVGMNGYLPKPIDIKKLLNLLNRLEPDSSQWLSDESTG